MRKHKLACLVLLVSSVAADHYHPDLTTKLRSKIKQSHRNVYAFNTAENDATFWKNEAIAGIEKRVKENQNNKVARNVIMFLGDGLSIPTMMAARTLKGYRDQKTGEEASLFFENFPTVGLSKTYCLDLQIADSACTATAYLAGVKNNHGTIGVTGNVPRYDCEASVDTNNHLESIAAWALEDGRDAGIVTTTRITHASPAGAYAKIASRDWECDADIISAGFTTDVCPDIAHQLINTHPGNKFKVILGGGARNFIPKTEVDERSVTGSRLDGRNLIDEWLAQKTADGVTHQYIWNRTHLMELMDSPPEYLLGLFETSHLQYHLQADDTQPTLAELTEVAINSLRRNEKGYFLFVEGGRIDHAHHETWPLLALDETIEFDKAIKKAVEMVDDDTLIVVTADHAHVMTVNGYARRGTNILDRSLTLGDDDIPYMTLSYANGPGARVHTNGVRPDVTTDNDFMGVEWRSHAEVPLEEETHGGDDVAVLAYGPHHHLFTGLYEQSQIPWRMAYAACIGPGLHSEYCNSAALKSPLTLLYAVVLTILYYIYQR